MSATPEQMLNEISEQEFLSMSNIPIKYIGIYELDWLMDDNLLDFVGVIVAFENRRFLITSKAIGEDDFEFLYYDFSQDYDCRKIISSPDEPIYFIRKEDEKDTFRVLRFQIGNRPILVTADEDSFLTVGLSHWDINGEWLAFDNRYFFNDKNDLE